MLKTDFKVYRLGPIAAFDSSAHSIRQILMSAYFGRYGIDSYLYLRNMEPTKGREELSKFVGINFPSNLHIRLSLKHKGLSSLQNFINLVKDLRKNRKFTNWVFLSKADHVVKLSKLKNLLDFKIVFENHQDKTFIEAVKKADVVYTVSPKVYDKLKGFPKVKLWTYHYPVKDELINFSPKFREKEVYTLGYLGSLNPEKGIDFLLRAIKNLPVKLKIIGGKGDKLEKARKLAKEYGVIHKVKFTGFVPQNLIPCELSEVDIMVAPFTDEQKTIPLKVYEYLAVGIPTIASDIGPVRIVAKDYFFYFKPKDEKSFTEAFREVTENPERTRRVMIESKEYGKQFHWKEVIKRILSDLEKVKC